MTKNMVSMLSNLSVTMCHAFIKDYNMMPPPINLFNYSPNEQPNEPLQDKVDD